MLVTTISLPPYADHPSLTHIFTSPGCLVITHPSIGLFVSTPQKHRYGRFSCDILNITSSSASYLPIDTKSPADFRWIKRWAAIGESFAAGIGCGHLYSKSEGDHKCSRYDRSWPAILERRFGPSAKSLSLRQDLDLVVLTAATCVFLPFMGEKATGLSFMPCMHRFSMIPTTTPVPRSRTGFSFFFPVSGLKLTVDRRQKFNTLVSNINKAIKEVVVEYRKSIWIKYRITYADWDLWPHEEVKGQFCVPDTTRAYTDSKQPDLHFFRPEIKHRSFGHDELKRRDLISRGILNETAIQEEATVYNSVFYKSVNSAAHALIALASRDTLMPTPAGCHGDNNKEVTFGKGLPDRWGKFFHPNELGHRTIASFVLEAIIAERYAVLGTNQPICKRQDTFKCFTNTATYTRYISADILTETHKTDCKELIPRAGQGCASKFSEADCLGAFARLIHGCDPRNPMNFKFGGSSLRERPWLMIQKPYGRCHGTYMITHSSYTLYGAGWAYCLDMISCDCHWKFKYFDQPD
ncbi:hypothetical protein BDW59DRAFT_176470 [Aspergillus cavernicola]|uniref:Uncharacterized protein n=1 Tax=Aspergillus cavernicola TaxID=176166 RepID=A0ABR4HFZ6_9EURO